MTTILRPRQVLLVCALAIAGVAASASEASATHFRYGSMTWQVVNPAQPNVIKVRFDSVFRWSFPWGSGASVCPGPPFVATDVTGAGACPPVGQVLSGTPGQITSTVGVRVNGSPTVVNTFPLNLTVTSINSTEDWFTGTFEATLTFPPVNSDLFLDFSSNARISTLQDGNADRGYRIRTRVNVRMPPSAINQPPTVATLPVITLALGQPASFPIAASDPNGDPVTFSIPPDVESGLITPAPAGFALSPAGVVTWLPTVAGLYAVQVKASDGFGAYTVADLILQVKPLVGQPPVVLIDGTPGPKTATIIHGSPVTFTVEGTDPENTPVLLSHAGLPLGATMSPSLPFTGLNPTSTFSWTPAQAAIGTYVLNFAALDGDGRQATNSMVVTVTGNPPTIACNPSPTPLEATSAAGALFNVVADVDDLDGDNLTVRFFVDGTQRQTFGLLPPPATVSFAAVVGLGDHTYEGQVSDGLTSSSCTGTFAVEDTVAPVLTFVPGDQTLPATSPAGAIATFTVTASDEVDPDPTVVCSHLSDDTFPVGTTTVTCTASDDFGNRRTRSFTITVFDDVAPSLTVPGDMTVEATSPAGAAVPFVTDATDVVDGPIPVICTATSGDTFALGATRVDCSATDESGNRATASFLVTVVDTTAPAFTAPADITVAATSPAGAVVTYVVPVATDAVDVMSGVTCVPPPGGVFALGTTVVICTSSDLAGNSTERGFRITVFNTAPTFTPPADIAVAATSAAGALVVFVAIGTDAEDGPIAAVCAPPSGFTFPLGITPVTCTVTDRVGATASGGFLVIVTNNAPAFVPPADITVPATSPAGAVVTFTATGADVEDGPIPADCVPPSGSTFPIGTTTVTCTVTDVAGATASGTFTVKVVDNTPPVFTRPPVAVTITQCRTPNLGVVTATDAAGPVTVTNNAPAVFPLGITVVTWTATDAAGNKVTVTQTVTAILGDDASCCPAGTNIILGTGGSDVLVGTNGRDCILLRGGNDVCNSFGGDDFVSGGDGDDVIDTGDGNDVLFAGPGRDNVATGNGNDRIDGGPGNDICNPGSGSNTVVACEASR